MFYEIIAIVRSKGATRNVEAQDIMRTVGKLILNNRGVVRNIEYQGTKHLPKIINRHQQTHIFGTIFSMKFDTSPAVQSEIKRTMNMDPRIVRTMIVNGDR
ncbi:ribosomal protein S6 [Nadsonia fulvescens var. elongata DSM 6958]|uniref:Ribosomal protein S6 n=1 Tax=Nadsonia fulvescens var. elongata DSM 6958 TaxID=857566 RepID=A0A1E3PFJ4_9ASCO|nr:ribosomal protein S6 [Nadsonia fulvescens var. elongata DSM 6958]